jgi:hypothetical protein
MMLAAQPKSPLKRLILDDIGAFVGLEALQRIASYVGQDPGFADLADLEAYMRSVNTGYGPLAAEHWRHVVEHGSRRDEAVGCWRQHYDSKIIEPFKTGFSDPVVLWPLWPGSHPARNDYTDCCRADWLAIGMALKHEFGESGWSIWNDGSRKSKKYNLKYQTDSWASFKGGYGKPGARRKHAAQAR